MPSTPALILPTERPLPRRATADTIENSTSGITITWSNRTYPPLSTPIQVMELRMDVSPRP
jgi:hypothetical protein